MRRHSIFSGWILIIIAFIMMGSAMGIIPDIPWFKLIVSGFLTAWAVKALLDRDFFGTFMSASIIAWIFDEELMIEHLTPFPLVAAAACLGIGLNMVIGKRKRHVHIQYKSDEGWKTGTIDDVKVEEWTDGREVTLENYFNSTSKYVNSASFSSDSKKIVSASDDKTIRIWDVEKGKQIGEPITGHTANIIYASFSPDGKKIVSASWDGTIRIWDAKTGKQFGKTITGHTSFVNSASFSPDGTKIVSASEDRTIRIWDAETGEQISEPLMGHLETVYSAVASAMLMPSNVDVPRPISSYMIRLCFVAFFKI